MRSRRATASAKRAAAAAKETATKIDGAISKSAQGVEISSTLSLLEQKTAAVQQQGPKVLTALADFYDSLTPSQQQQVRERLAQRHGGWGGRGPGF